MKAAVAVSGKKHLKSRAIVENEAEVREGGRHEGGSDVTSVSIKQISLCKRHR